jgi:hypothetical protein
LPLVTLALVTLERHASRDLHTHGFECLAALHVGVRRKRNDDAVSGILALERREEQITHSVRIE